MSEKQKDAAGLPAPDRATLVARARAHSQTLRNTCKTRLAPLLAEALEAKGIWLFGSVARGEAVESSNADILVEVGDHIAQDRFLDRLSLASTACRAARLPFACDIVPLSSEEIADKLQSGNLVFRELWAEKVRLI